MNIEFGVYYYSNMLNPSTMLYFWNCVNEHWITVKNLTVHDLTAHVKCSLPFCIAYKETFVIRKLHNVAIKNNDFALILVNNREKHYCFGKNETAMLFRLQLN